MQPDLTEFIGGDVERCGLILRDHMVIELKNVSAMPEVSFEISAQDIVKYVGDAIATWHTHPAGNGNLSGADYVCFLNWPKLRHFILGTDGLHEYRVENGAVIRA